MYVYEQAWAAFATFNVLLIGSFARVQCRAFTDDSMRNEISGDDDALEAQAIWNSMIQRVSLKIAFIES